MNLEILVSDGELVVINKKRFSHSVRGENLSIEERLGEQLGTELFSINRLDYETSGLLLFTKSSRALDSWRKAFNEKKIYKSYLVLLDGELTKEIFVSGFLGSRYRRSKKVSFSEKNKDRFLYSESAIVPVAVSQCSNYTFASVHTHFGRRHQVRVHCSHSGFPLTGDALYGGEKSFNASSGFFLHAWKVQFGERAFSAHLHEDFTEILKKLGISTTFGN